MPVSNPFGESELDSPAESIKEYAVVGPSAHRDFLPWHHPRKHFVRSEQWAFILEKHLQLNPKADGTIKWLGLPGDDLLDLRYIAERICEPMQQRLLFLGLNNSIKADSPNKYILDRALDQMRKLPLVDEGSNVIVDSFNSLADSRSIAYQTACKLGPFDVVNLDLCDGMVKNRPNDSQKPDYNAIQTLLGNQFRNPHPWLFYFTSLIGEQHCHEQVLRKFLKLMDENIETCDGFGAAIEAQFGAPLTALNDPCRLFVVNLCGILKWLGAICVNQTGWRMETMVIDCYTVFHGAADGSDVHLRDPSVDDLVSVAIRFVPKRVVAYDPNGLGTARSQADSECRIALEAVKRMKERRRVEDCLREDEGIRQRIINEKMILLEGAGYARERYLEKVEEWLA